MSRRSLSRGALLIVVIGLPAVAFLFLADPLFDLDFGLIVDRTTATSSVMALTGRDLLRLDTLEVVHKVVFPYDFIPEELNWRVFLEQTADRGDLSPLEQRLLDVYALSVSIGIDPASKRKDFVVITAIARIGIDLDSGMGGQQVVIDDAGSVSIDLPPVTITNLIINDPSSEEYGYPDVGMTPESWRRVTGFVAESVAKHVEAKGYFAEAELRAQEFLRRFYHQAGYDSVSFRE